jgi:glucosamine kinase
MAIFLAVDAGGTKADYLLADETRTLARTRSGTIKRLRTDAATAVANLQQGLEALTLASGVPMSAVTQTCIGTAGESVPLVADWLRAEFATRVGGGLLLLGDVEIALDAAFRGGPGVLALAGTGSNVAGRNAEGTLSTCGGYGPVLSDQGSGHAIGLRALRSIYLAMDQDRTTLLRDAVLDFWKLPSTDLLIEFVHSAPAPDISKLAHLVVQCAGQGDVIAQEVLQREGEELAYLVRLLIRRFRAMPGGEDFSPPLAFTGSILQNVPAVRASLVATVQGEFPQVQPMDGVCDPVDGALFRARTEAGYAG